MSLLLFASLVSAFYLGLFAGTKLAHGSYPHLFQFALTLALIAGLIVNTVITERWKHLAQRAIADAETLETYCGR